MVEGRIIVFTVCHGDLLGYVNQYNRITGMATTTSLYLGQDICTGVVTIQHQVPLGET